MNFWSCMNDPRMYGEPTATMTLGGKLTVHKKDKPKNKSKIKPESNRKIKPESNRKIKPESNRKIKPESKEK